MADSENYMQQVNAQYQASRKKRQQRFSSNVINPVDSQSTMDRLQNSNVGDFSGGGSDEGIVPLTMATGGTPATTAGYSGKPGGTPATQAGFGDRLFGRFGGGQNSGGDCANGQCGIPRGTTVASMPTATTVAKPYPRYDNIPERQQDALNRFYRAQDNPDAVLKMQGIQAALHANRMAQEQALLQGGTAAAAADEGRLKQQFTPHLRGLEASANAAEQAVALTHSATPAGMRQTDDEEDKALMDNTIDANEYANSRTNRYFKQNIGRTGATGTEGVMPGQVDDTAQHRTDIFTKSLGRAHAIKSVQFWVGGNAVTPEGKKQRLDAAYALGVQPDTMTMSYQDYILGTVMPSARETMGRLATQAAGNNPSPESLQQHMDDATAQGDLLQHTLLSAPPQQSGGWFSAGGPSTWGAAPQQGPKPQATAKPPAAPAAPPAKGTP